MKLRFSYFFYIFFVYLCIYLFVHLTGEMPDRETRPENVQNLVADSEPTSNKSAPYQVLPKKRVLVWLGDDELGWVFNFSNCPIRACTATMDRSLLKQSDAVVFRFDMVHGGRQGLPKWRHPKQQYIFRMYESSGTDQVQKGRSRYDRFENYFNMTMSFRKDSDIVMPYREIRRKKVPTNEYADYAKHKTKLAATMINNYHLVPGGRNQILQHLKKVGLKFDKLGGTCRLDTESCYVKFLAPYKFYLAFENSICKDYVTEKFFFALDHKVVPVVMGGGNYISEAPPHSYIDALDFKTVEDLKNYLLFLDRNDEMYNEYFLWRNNYEVRVTRNVCKLCEILHDPDVKSKTIPIKHWWMDKYPCKRWTEGMDKKQLYKQYEYNSYNIGSYPFLPWD